VSSGRPGNVLTARAIEFPGFAANSYVLFVFPDAVAVPVPAEFGEKGIISFPVPYFIDPDSPAGYRTGDCQIALPVNGRPVGAVGFYIEPLLPVENAAARFRDMVASWAAATNEQLEMQRTLPGAESATGIIRRLSDTRDQALADLAAKI